VLNVTRLYSVLLVLAASPTLAQEVTLTSKMHHLRNLGTREWSDFPEKPESDHLERHFRLKEVKGDWTLTLRQQDIKQDWRVRLNGKELARLHRDEIDMRVAFPVSAEMLVQGDNSLTIESASKRGADDIRVGEIQLHPRKVDGLLGEATLKVIVHDGSGKPTTTPCRITIVDEGGSLVQTGAISNDHLAVRPGAIYTATGTAVVPLPAGRYTVYAGRGLEYSLATLPVDLKSGDEKSIHLSIRREVSTEGYVACDTHVHTRTHSGHGDSTVQERMITLAGEGIELPIATDHNVHIDHNPFAREMKVRRYFTPVIGNEVTTRTAHFNIFPVKAGSPVPDHRSPDWSQTFARIDRVPGAKIVILNHARDLHSGVTPFGPKLFNDAVGVNVDGWQLRANAMEVLNSSATQTDIMQLFHDWMTLLNRGHAITPIGSSDSHDVARHFVGQGRTYIRCDDSDPGNIDVDAAVNSLLQGQVRVSYGLLTELTVEGKYTSGELARIPGEEISVNARVLAPHWIEASMILLFANGELIREEQITPQRKSENTPGLKWQGSWTLPRPKHDVHLVAIAIGPGIDGSYWRTAKAYQPSSPVWEPHVIGCSGAVWIDADGDGRPTPAFDYARGIVADSRGDLVKVLTRLSEFDSAIAAQCADILQNSGTMLISPPQQKLIRSAPQPARAGFEKYVAAWRRNQVARAGE
jgi:hypothetical protein